MKLPALILAAALVVGSSPPVRAADDTKVKAATEQVEAGGRKIGDGKLGPGFEEMFKGVGNTIVEGAKYSGHAIKDFFSRAFGS
jgi:hypothetical protein